MCNGSKNRILMVHQGSELYGSDRSFLSSVDAVVSGFNGVDVDVILPSVGLLTNEIERFLVTIDYRPFGYVRKEALKRSPVSTAFFLLKEVFFYIKKAKDYDVVYINTIVCFSALLASCFSSSKVRFVVHVREIPTPFVLFFFRSLLRLSSCELIYNSEATKKAFSLPGDVVLNGVSDPFGKLIERKHVCEQVKILIVGRINSWKGQDFFLRSIPPIKELLSIRVVGGVFGGQDFYLDELEGIVNKYNIDVSFFGFCKDPSEHYLWADYIVVPSKLPEPFGRVAVEAMAASKPVIAAAHGGLCEIVEHGSDGYLFEPNSSDDLKQVLVSCHKKSEEEYDLMSYLARKKYEEVFSERIYKENIVSVLSQKLKDNS